MTDSRQWIWIVLAVLLLLVAGCVPAKPTRTIRPEVPLDPWEERTVTSEASSQQYRYLYAPGPSEDAPVLLMLPGGIFDHRIWLGAHELADQYHLYALDWPDESTLFTGQPDDFRVLITDFLNSVGIKELVVAGVSAGGLAGIVFASTQEEFILQSLVLVSSNVPSVTPKEVRQRTRMSNYALNMKPDKLRARVQTQVEELDLEQAPGGLTRDDFFWVRPYSYYQQMFSVAANLGDTRPPVERIECPVLVIHGGGDEVIKPELASESAELFPDAQYVELADKGHSMVFIDASEVMDAIRTFLTAHDLGANAQTLPQAGGPPQQ